MISRLLIAVLLSVCFSCDSKNLEQKLLNKSKPSGLYGNMSKTKKVYGVDKLILNKNDYIKKFNHFPITPNLHISCSKKNKKR